jgi:hypothetical protein
MDALATVLREAGFDAADHQELANLLAASDEEQGVRHTVDFEIDLLFSSSPPPPPRPVSEGTPENAWTAGSDENLPRRRQQPQSRPQVRDEHKERTDAEVEVRILLQKVPTLSFRQSPVL